MIPRELRRPAFLAALAVMVAGALGMNAAIRAYGFHLRKLPIHAPQGRQLRALPAETMHWTRIGADETVQTEEMLEVLGTQNYLTRVYGRKESADGKRPERVQMHAAYYTGMIDTVPHVPERCNTGAGWQLTGGPWVVDVPLDGSGWKAHPDATPEEAGRTYAVRLSNEYSPFGRGTYVRLPRDLAPDRPLKLRVSRFSGPEGVELYAGYFFIANGGWVASANEVRTLAFDLTDDYAYYLKVQFSSTDVESPEELAGRVGSLLDDLLGELMSCVPDWTEVQAGRYPEDHRRRSRE